MCNVGNAYTVSCQLLEDSWSFLDVHLFALLFINLKSLGVILMVPGEPLPQYARLYYVMILLISVP